MIPHEYIEKNPHVIEPVMLALCRGDFMQVELGNKAEFVVSNDQVHYHSGAGNGHWIVVTKAYGDQAGAIPMAEMTAWQWIGVDLVKAGWDWDDPVYRRNLRPPLHKCKGCKRLTTCRRPLVEAISGGL